MILPYPLDLIIPYFVENYFNIFNGLVRTFKILHWIKKMDLI